MATTSVPAQPSADARKSWIGRHKLLTAFLLLVILILIGGYIWAWPLMKLRFHSQYQAALEAVRNSPQVAERIGKPIDASRPFPGGSVHEEGDRGEAAFFFDVAGPNGMAKVTAKSRKLDNQWGFSQLEVEFADKERIDLARTLTSGHEDTPKFDPNAKQQEVKEPDLPLDVKLPDLPPEPRK